MGNFISFKDVSDKVAQLTIKIKGRYQVNIIKAHLPTSNHSDEEVEAVYEDIDNIYTSNKAHYKIMVGFDAKIRFGEVGQIC